MPQSKKRKPHANHIDYVPHKKKRKSAVPVAVIFCALIGFGIAWLASDASTVALIAGTLLGALIGYVGGKQMDKTFDKK